MSLESPAILAVITLTKHCVMKTYDNLTDGLQTVLLMYQKGYVNHIAFLTSKDKIQALGGKWEEEFGTRLPAHKRHYRKSKGLANAVAYSMPIIGSDKVQVILMATKECKAMPESTEWHRQNWTNRYPIISRFHMLKETRNGKSGMTWRIDPAELSQEEKYLNHLVHVGDASQVAANTKKIVAFYPMFGGVRRQIRTMLKEGARQWQHKHKTSWPGSNPDALPILAFKRAPGVREDVASPW